MLHVIVYAEIERGVGIGRRDDIPARPPAADMVERSEAARDVIGRIESRRSRGDEADALGRGGESGQERERLERGDRRAALQRLNGHVEDSQMVGHEERVELRSLQGLGEPLQMLKVEVGVGIGAGIAPPSRMNADRAHESAKMQLS